MEHLEQAALSILGKLPYGSYFQNRYLFALLIVILFTILAKVVLWICKLYLHRIAAKTKTKIDDLLFQNVHRPLFYFIIIYGIKVALYALDIDGFFNKIINMVLAGVFVLILSRTLDAIIETWGLNFAKKTRTNIDEVLLPLFHRASKVILIIIFLLWCLRIWSIDITPYLAGVGIGGVVLGLALQDSLKNVFGGISLILDKSFNLEDTIQLESGDVGRVQEIGLRSTKLLTPDNEIIFVPNGQLANMRIRNVAKPTPKLRKTVDFSVEYGADTDKVKKIVLQAIEKMENVYDDPVPDVIFVEMGDYGLKFKARFWVDWDKGYDKWVEATGLIYEALHKAKMGIPYPTRTIFMKRAK